MFKVLSVDGGGIRGVIPAALLTAIETKTGRRTAELFDLIIGTSTGGIIALALTVPDGAGKPKYGASDLLELYEKKGGMIFERSFWDGVTDLGGIADERYSHKNLVSILKAYMGEARLSQAVTPVVVTAYDLERREPYFFKTSRASEEPAKRDHLMWVAARATSAAPTFFEPALLNVQETGDEVRRVLVDGGVFVNNPALSGYVEAIAAGAAPGDILVVSLGTGVHTRKIPYAKAKKWGYVGWVKPLISVMMDGSADAADYQLRQLIPDAGAGQRYFRFDTDLDKALDDMDAAHHANIEALKAEAADILLKQSNEIEKLLTVL